MASSRIERELLRNWSQLKKTALRARIGQRWGRAPRDAGIAQRVYPDYDTYLAHQRLKVDALRVKSLEGHDRRFYAAREAAGRPDLRFHDLRHTGAVLTASTGATIAELMARLGHSTPAAAMRYQHAAQGRDQSIAELLSQLVVDGP